MITINSETVNQCYDDIIKCAQDHDEEVNPFYGQRVIDPNHGQYLALEQSGLLHCMIARDRRELVGYYVSTIAPHINYRDHVVGSMVTMYVKPEYRGGTVAYRMIKKALEDMKNSGRVDSFAVYMPNHAPFRELLEKLGFTKTEEKWEQCVIQQQQ
jgi:ribosomal protein S18 acetylase RimI-like enzyme